MKPKTKLEKVAGSLVTESALTILSVVTSSPLAALLPVLTKSLASERHRQRVEDALADISTVLECYSEVLRNLTDSQYKLINETVLTILQTTSLEKLKYLQNVVQNGLQAADLSQQDVTVLSRVIRDISAEEVDFLCRNFSYQRIQLGVTSGDVLSDTVLTVSAGGQDELLISGLISLGLIISAGPTMDDSGLLRFSNGVPKLIALLKSPAS